MILLIDNYDSFTYNIYQDVARFSNVCVIRNDEHTMEEIRRMNPNGIILSPGPGGPKDAGVSLEVGIERSAGSVSVSTAEGEILLVGGSGNVALNAVDGPVTVAGASGKIAINAVDGDVSVSESDGAIAVTAVDGDVALVGITSDNVSVNAVDGDIGYVGTIADGGRYVLSTHDGDLDVLIPNGANARISIDTFSGELDTDFAVELEGDFGKKRISFTVGTGKALVELSAFDGIISLRQE